MLTVSNLTNEEEQVYGKKAEVNPDSLEAMGGSLVWDNTKNILTTDITLENTELKGGLKITKTTENQPQGSTDSFTFTIQLREKKVDQEGEVIPDQYEAVIGSYVGTKDNDATSYEFVAGTEATEGWGVTTVSLTSGQTISFTDLPEGAEYIVTEQSPGASDKWRLKNYTGTTGFIDDTTVSVASFVNEYEEEAKGEITLTKTGKDNAKLAGAKFDLYKVKTGEETADTKINTEDLVTDAKGEIKVTGLEPGSYYFVETLSRAATTSWKQQHRQVM